MPFASLDPTFPDLRVQQHLAVPFAAPLPPLPSGTLFNYLQNLSITTGKWARETLAKQGTFRTSYPLSRQLRWRLLLRDWKS